MTNEEIQQNADEIASAIYEPLFPNPTDQADRAKAQCVRTLVQFGVNVRAAQKEADAQKVAAVPTTRAITDVMRVGGQEPRPIAQYRDDVLAAIRTEAQP
ncbi:MAG TPA: hypothetical protein VFX97_17000 [Pyrinomonadaceae bacterium]|nr:hypothetical protein [Pyrinomonadaceae bacterium]